MKTYFFLFLLSISLLAQQPVVLQPWMQVEGTYNGQKLGSSVGFAGKIGDSTIITASDVNGIRMYHVKTPNDTTIFQTYQGLDCSLGDFNGDGVQDLLISGNPTKIYLGISPGVFDTIAFFTKYQEPEGYAFGRHMAVGKINGDNYDDLVITDAGYPNGDYVGRIYVFFSDAQMDTIPDIILNGERMFSEFGVGIVCGDLNNDGFDDIVVKGYDGNDFNIHQDFAYIKIYLGDNQIDTLEWKYLKGGGHLSSGVECFDVNGDNKKDLLWTDYSSTDSIYILKIHFSQEGNIDTTASMIIFNEWAYNIANVRDMNGDGFNDILISSNYSDNGGSSYIFVYSGGPNMDTNFDAAVGIGGVSNLGAFGSMAGIGDVNGDGLDDILVGATNYNWFSDRGKWFIFLGDTNIPVSSVIDEQNDIPKEFTLFQNYPNPFNPSTNIQYLIGNRQFVKIEIYDVLGKEITTLVNKEQVAGNYTIEFNSKNLSSGVYFYKINLSDVKGNKQTETKSMILIK